MPALSAPSAYSWTLSEASEAMRKRRREKGGGRKEKIRWLETAAL
jgi:hypothetical protein